jgi:hypothetical protein
MSTNLVSGKWFLLTKGKGKDQPHDYIIPVLLM